MNDEETPVVTDTPSTSEETPDTPAPETIVEEPSETGIDFEKELQELEEKPRKEHPHIPSKYTPREKAEHALKSIYKQVQELGGDPADILGLPGKQLEDEGQYVTKEDVQSAVSSVLTRQQNELKARTLAKSEAELKVIMWWVEEKGLNVDDAYFMANKKRLQNTFDEIKRIPPPPGQGSGAGQKSTVVQGGDPSPEAIRIFHNRGFQWNPKTKQFEGKHNIAKFDSVKNTWITTRKDS